MEVVDKGQEGDSKWRILKLDTRKLGSDDIYVSFSLGREHGPIIERVGNDSPRMLTLDAQAIGDSYTSDPQYQRLGCWFISESHRTESLLTALRYFAYYYSQLCEIGEESFIENKKLLSGNVGDMIKRFGNDIFNKIKDLKVSTKKQEKEYYIETNSIVNICDEILSIIHKKLDGKMPKNKIVANNKKKAR